MQIVSYGDNLHEMSKSVFLEKNKKTAVDLSYADLAQNVIKVNGCVLLQIAMRQKQQKKRRKGRNYW